jgi:hypothetical protein
MKTTILLLAMTLSFAAQSQTLENPVVLKSFDKDKDKAVWYTSKKSEESNTRKIIYGTLMKTTDTTKRWLSTSTLTQRFQQR